MGRLLAEHQEQLNKIDLRKSVLLSVLCYILLLRERRLTLWIGDVWATDCYLMLVPLTFFCFVSLYRWDFSTPHAKLLRRMSILIYTTQGFGLLAGFAVFGSVQNSVVQCTCVFLLSSAVCVLLALGIMRLQKTKLNAVLRYAS